MLLPKETVQQLRVLPNPEHPLFGTLPYVELLACVAHAPPALVLFFLFLFSPLTFAFVLTAVAMLCKPGCAVSAADTSSA